MQSPRPDLPCARSAGLPICSGLPSLSQQHPGSKFPLPNMFMWIARSSTLSGNGNELVFILRTAVSFSRLDQTELCLNEKHTKHWRGFVSIPYAWLRACVVFNSQTWFQRLLSLPDLCSAVTDVPWYLSKGAMNVLSCTKQKALEVLKNPFQLQLESCLDLEGRNWSGSELCL